MKLSTVHSPQSTVRSGGRFRRACFDIGLRPSNFGDRDGVALVITLIMLAIITFMAVTFLVLSQRERSSVSTAMDQKTARNASDAGFARVTAELLTRIMIRTNFQDFDLLTSTNYINLIGLHGGVPGSLSPTNVNYDYLDDSGHSALTPQDHNINIASLLFNPRPPVYVVTNRGTGDAEFRFYLDLNRNGRYDANGNWPVVVSTPGGLKYVSTNGAFISTNLPIASGTYLLTNIFVGDPEWIGVLERPEELHSADNRFIARYAYLVVPIGKTLDINTMHNQAVTKTMVVGVNSDGYLRNQGVGPWELNLAAFLVDLNTNIWYARPTFPLNRNFYEYDRGDVHSALFPNGNRGLAFQDAFSLLSYRYNNDYTTLASASLTFPSGAIPLLGQNIDQYSDGPLMLTTSTNESAAPVGPDVISANWAGSENPNHYFTTQDLFDKTKTSYGMAAPGFSSRLQQVGGSNDTYNAYTFYRLLAQLGTDSTVDDNKLNINFKNTDIHGNIIPGMETNLIPWTAPDFFTNAANRILQQVTNQMGAALSTAYIPLYPTNFYTPAVHRALQLAANIFDSTTNQTVPLLGGQTNAFLPSVFRPIFTSQNGQVWISGFEEVTNTVPLAFQYYDMAKASNSPGTLAGVNIYGVPWIIGAKKGLPNFNEYAMETAISFGRKLRLAKDIAGNNPIKDVKQLFEVGISNNLAIEAWNSYTNPYPRNLRMSASNEIGITVTNQLGTSLVPANWQNNFTFPTVTNIPANSWVPFAGQSSVNPDESSPSMIVPLQTSDVFFTNAMYLDLPTARFAPNNPAVFISEASAPMPELFLTTTNRVQFSLVDTTVTPNRVIDFVNLESISTVNISEEARHATTCGLPTSDPYTYWCTNLQANSGFTPGISLNKGINFQIGVSIGNYTLSRSGWTSVGADPNNMGQIGDFGDFVNRRPANTNLVMQTPFNPAAFIYQHYSWQANDPLVHYTIGDLTDPAKAAVGPTEANPPLDNIGKLNTRYNPWGGNLQNQDPNTMRNLSLKDPGVTQSSDWDFSTNKYPTLGWLGRVHRGTPWQTVYMKSPIANVKDWQQWSGNNVQEPNNNQDAAFTSPTNDYRLFDIFTTAISPTAARGQLNINQTNLAAWSAVLSGVSVITNTVNGANGAMVLPPAGVYDPTSPSNFPPVARLWKAINDTRANDNTNFMIFPNHTFQHLGDVLATPELTVGSPFLNTNSVISGQSSPLNGINDEIMERIPQQIMSLLTLNQTPRFVIYSFGQTLHPADHSLVVGGTFNGLCTNYQITAESAVRAVVRVEGTADPRFVNGRVDSQGRTYPPHLVVEQFNVVGPD